MTPDQTPTVEKRFRVYTPSKCDAAGVPLNWERCRTCGDRIRRDTPAVGTGNVMHRCLSCNGYGSLKAAALAWIVKFVSQ